MDAAAAAERAKDDDHKREEEEEAKAEIAAAAYAVFALRHDGDDLVRSIVDDLVDDTTRVAAASVVTNRMVAYIAERLATQLVDAVAPCLVSRSNALEEFVTPSLTPNEEPTTTPPLDISSRHAIAAQSPRAASAPTPKTSTRVIRLGAFAARSLLSAAAVTPASPSRPSSVSSSFRARSNNKRTPQPHQQRDPSKPVPGVPFSVEPIESPRKAVAQLRSPQDESPIDNELRQEEDANEAPTVASTRQSPLATSRHKRVTPRRLPASAPSPATSSSSSSAPSSASAPGRTAWSLTLPVHTPESSALGPPNEAIAIEFHVPRRSSFLASSDGVLPDVSRSPSGHRRSSIVHSPPPPQAAQAKGTRVLPLVDESTAVTVDEIAMLGVELHTSLALAPGVTQQTINGVVLQSGPELPVEKTRMRRATFLDGGLLFEPQHSPSTVSTTRLPERASLSSIDQSAALSVHPQVEHSSEDACDRVFLTLAKDHELRVESSPLTPTPAFRKPSKIARPCTRSSAAASGCHCGDHATATNVSVNPHDAFGELVKQRAFQRKPSSAAASPAVRRVSNWQAMLHNDQETIDTSTHTGSTRRPSRRATTSPLARRSLHPSRP